MCGTYKVYSSVWAVDDNIHDIYGEYISVVQLRLHVTHSCHHLWAIKIAAEDYSDS